MRFDFADCSLDTETLVLTRAGTPVAVEPQVFDLLVLLADNPGRVVTRDEMIASVWGGRIVSESAISARIAAARKAVGDDGKAQRVIRTVARRGLRMVAAVETGTPAGATPAGDVQRIRYVRNAEGVSLAYAITGSGPPLIRMGPVGTDLEAEWRVASERAMFDRLADRFRLLRFDHQGFGQSDRRLEKIDFDKSAENVATVADSAGFDRFALYSESGGAIPALHFAARYPERVSRLVLIGGYVDGRMVRDGTTGPDAIRGLIAEGWDDFQGGLANAYLLAYFPESPLDVVRELVGSTQMAASSDNMLLLRDASNHASVAHLLPRIACPTLIIHARDDAVHPLTEARKLAAGIPDAELVVLDTANHVPLPGHPTWEPFLDLFLDFLAG